MSLFSANWRTQVTNLLPSFIRSTSLIDFLTSLFEPIDTAGTSWTAFDNEVRKRVKFNGQKIILQAALNNIFGVTSPPIVVETDTGTGGTTFIYNNAEGNTVYIYNSIEVLAPTYIYNESEITDDYQFTVKIPAGIYTAELERRVKAEVDLYKLSGKKYIVQTY